MTNRFKRQLSLTDAQIGLWLGLANPYTAELCASAGFDWVLIDGEHAPNHLQSILAQLQAIAGTAAEPVVRPLCGDVNTIKQLLDIGAQTLLVPMVESAAHARAIVAATRYPPEGVRGVGSALARASNWNRCSDYLETVALDICVIMQIETADAVSNAGEIVKVDGVDGLFVGLSDLAASMGHLGRPDHPAVMSAFDLIVGVAMDAGKAVGTLAANEEIARYAIAAGCRFVGVGSDVGLLARATTNLAGTFGRRKSDERVEPSVY